MTAACRLRKAWVTGEDQVNARTTARRSMGQKPASRGVYRDNQARPIVESGRLGGLAKAIAMLISSSSGI